MEYITQLLNSNNIISAVVTFLLALFSAKEVIQILKYFGGLLGIRFKADIEKEELKEHLDELEKHVKEKDKKVDELIEYNKRSLEANKIQTRNSIIRICEEALENEEIEFYELQSLEDMYSMYTDVLGGNSYATTMVNKTRRLPVVKKHEE